MKAEKSPVLYLGSKIDKLELSEYRRNRALGLIEQLLEDLESFQDLEPVLKLKDSLDFAAKELKSPKVF